MSSSAKADPIVTTRLKSAVLWGVVGALFFLVFHQAYLLMDGQFLGVGPVAAVAVGVFVATVLASYFTVGHLDGLDVDEATVEAADAGTPGSTTGRESEPAPEPEPITEPEATEPDAEESEDDDAVDGAMEDGDPDDEWIWGDQDG